MMEHCSLDPYEQQLLKVFDSYDHENRGSLDKDGLTQLCHTLQLEEQGNDLIKALLKDRKTVRATFTEFKDELLNLLGNIQNKNDESDLEGSPEREVSPKYVCGAKKYGRRSRPRVDDLATKKEQNDMNYININAVQRSNSQNEVTYSKKRKTNLKLKRCTSFPGNHEYQKPENNFITSNSDFVCTEEMLREAWKKLGVGEDGSLNQTELILVCDSIGLNKLADSVIRQLSNKLVMDYDRKISFQELLEALQQDETWHEFLNTTPPSNETFDVTLTTDTNFPNSKVIKHLKLGPDGSGYINLDVIIELWEHAGIMSPKSLLTDLGFINRQINVVELSTVLEKEIKGLNELRTDHNCNPHVALLQAFLTLYQTEIKCLKSIVEQMHAEREKLKCDVYEANNRATLLAQEVDDNVAKMELNTAKHVNMLEQRHADILKEVTEQFSNDKEQMALLNQTLEDKILCLENEEVKLQDDLVNAQKYSNSIEMENQELNNKIQEMKQIEILLKKQLDLFEEEKLKFKDLEIEQRNNLLVKLSELQMENTHLKDKHDEMLSKIEILTNERGKATSTPTFNQCEDSMEENVAISCEGVGLGAKRRSDESPSKDINVFGIMGEESPRLGKVRKYHKRKTDFLELPFTSSESGFDTEIDCADSSLSVSINENEEITRLQTKITCLEQLLKKHSIPIPTNLNIDTSPDNDLQEKMKLENISKYCVLLDELLKDVKTDLNQMNNDDNKDLRQLSERLQLVLVEKPMDLFVSKSEEQLEVIYGAKEIEVSATLDRYKAENVELLMKIEDLESCIELLRNEYEKCEEYWQSKLDEERKLYELEQKESNEKLTELLSQIAEYQEQNIHLQEESNRLPVIEESFNLEIQFTDLEREYDEFKEQTELQIAEKDQIIFDLQQRLEELSCKDLVDAGVQVLDKSMEEKLENLSNHVLESTNLFSVDTMPFNYIATPASLESVREDSASYVWNKETPEHDNVSNSLPHDWQSTHRPRDKLYSAISLPSTSSIENNATPIRQKRTRRHDRLSSQQRLQKKNNLEAKDQTDSLPNKWNGVPDLREEACLIPLNNLHSLQAEKHNWKQRCKKLQHVLKQQHLHYETQSQYTWQHYRSETVSLHAKLKYLQEKFEVQLRANNELHDRLARTDLLVKDMYVENSYLLANNQRLEQRCHMLSQCTNSNSV